jgi:hypothetical protein
MRVFLLVSSALSLVNGFIKVRLVTHNKIRCCCSKIDIDEENPDFWNSGEVEWDFPVANKTTIINPEKKDTDIISLKESEVLPVASASAIIQLLYREKLQFDIGFSEVMNIREQPTMHMNIMDVAMILYVILIDVTYIKTKELEKNNMYNQKSVSIMVNYIKYKKYLVPIFIVVSSVFAKNVKYAF